jgi:antitoxin (DNA-binding transcriptional repressor) of toxin-antitoxin stability system
MVMKTVGIADLRARLSEHLKFVRGGQTLTVLDRTTPVALIVPFSAGNLDVRPATRRPGDLLLPEPSAQPTDSLAPLLEERGLR